MNNSLVVYSTEKDEERAQGLVKEMIAEGKTLEVIKQQPLALTKISSDDKMELAVYSVAGGILAGAIGGMTYQIPFSCVNALMMFSGATLFFFSILGFLMMIIRHHNNKEIIASGSVDELLKRLKPLEVLRLEEISSQVEANSKLTQDFHQDPLKFCELNFNNNSRSFALEIGDKLKEDPFYLSKALKTPEQISYLPQKK